MQSVLIIHECVLLGSRDEYLMLNFCPIEFWVLANHNYNSCVVFCSVSKSSSEGRVSKLTLFILCCSFCNILGNLILQRYSLADSCIEMYLAYACIKMYLA